MLRYSEREFLQRSIEADFEGSKERRASQRMAMAEDKP